MVSSYTITTPCARSCPNSRVFLNLNDRLRLRQRPLQPRDTLPLGRLRLGRNRLATTTRRRAVCSFRYNPPLVSGRACLRFARCSTSVGGTSARLVWYVLAGVFIGLTVDRQD